MLAGLEAVPGLEEGQQEQQQQHLRAPHLLQATSRPLGLLQASRPPPGHPQATCRPPPGHLYSFIAILASLAPGPTPPYLPALLNYAFQSALIPDGPQGTPIGLKLAMG